MNSYDLLDPEVQVVICDNDIVEIQDGGFTDYERLFQLYPYFLVSATGRIMSDKIRMTDFKAETRNDYLRDCRLSERWMRVVEAGELR